MSQKISDSLQNVLKWTIPFLLVFAFFYGFNEKKSEQVVVLMDGKNEGEIIDELQERGYISNSFSYIVAKVALKLGIDIESGGFILSQNMGPFSLLAALASPEYKYVAVIEGMRNEQIGQILKEKLEWSDEESKEFIIPENICILSGGEGHLFPGKYLVHKDSTPDEIKKMMQDKLNEAVKDVLQESSDKKESDKILNMNQVLIIASLIQREAAGKHDMKLISGIIWNRIFDEMPLQIDATLQYAKGNEDNGWWPPVKSEDKYIESPYNTYKTEGLPPGPISNPGIAAIEAALNPDNTNCIFYLHDRNRVIHCSSNYSDHKKNVRRYLK